MNILRDKVAIVTGGTSGIGESIARKFAIEGAIVIITGRNLERGMKISGEITSQGNKALFIQCDTGKENDIIHLINEVVIKFDKIDIVVNNAGIFKTGSIETLDVDLWDEVFNINVRGYYLVCKYSIPYLKKNGGVILNNSSIAGLQSYASGQSYLYSSSKSAVIQLTRIIAKNYGKYNIRANAICPGIVKTPIFDNFDEDRFKEKIPLGRVAVTEDISSVALFLVSENANYLTGIVLPIDGGLSL